MSNFQRAVKALNDVDESIDHLADNAAYVTALEAAGLLVPDARIIRTPEELEALAREEGDARALAGEAGIVWEAITLWGLCQEGFLWSLPAVVIATGDQVREAREAMEMTNER